MTRKVAPCVPWQQIFRGAASGGRQLHPRELCRALSDSIDALAPAATAKEAAKSLGDGLGGQMLQVASEDVRTCLRAVLRRLEATREDGALSCLEAQDMVSHLLAADVPARLVACLDALDFEERKDAMRVFGAVMRLGPATGAAVGTDEQVTEYMRGHPRIVELLLEGCGSPQVFCHCSQMLRCCTRCPQIVAHLLDQRAADQLIALARRQTFDVSSEAFSSLRELLLAHKAVSAAYLEANFAEFFGLYNSLLQVEDYVTQRQALRLLGEVLLNRSFMEVMVAYVGDEQFLQIHMNLLRDNSKAIQLEAFHVFKIFVANPNKPQKVQLILHRNKDRLTKLLETSLAKRGDDKHLTQDMRTVIGVLQALEPPARSPMAGAGSAEELLPK